MRRAPLALLAGRHMVTNPLRAVIVALLAINLCACCPCRHIATSSKDSLRVEVRTRTEYLRDTVYCEIPLQSERVTVRDTTSRLENDFALTDARINPDGSLFHSLMTKPQRRPLPFLKPVEHRDSIVYRDRTQTATIQVPRQLSWWQQTQIRGFWILLAVAGAGLVIACRKQIASQIRKWA